MFLSDLQSKDIISTKDGRRLGRIVDAEITPQGTISYLIIEEKKNLKKFVLASNDTKVSFENITKIGEDVILINI